MKYILFLIILLIPIYSYAGCEELNAALLNVEKAIQQKTEVLADPKNDYKQARVQKEIEELVKLRQVLSEQRCDQNGKPAAVAPPATSTSRKAPDPKPESQRKFKPAGKMY